MPRGLRARRRAAEAAGTVAVEVEDPVEVVDDRPRVEVAVRPLTLEERGERVLVMRRELAETEAALVADLRAAGVSWERIGWVLRTPSETVRRRYGPPSAPRTPPPGTDEPLPLDL